MSDLDALIAKLEAATEGSRELNGEIWWVVDRRAAEVTYRNAALGNPIAIPDKMPGGLGRLVVTQYAPHYTTSIDAALTLVPDGLDEEIKRARHRGWYVALWKPGRVGQIGDSSTPALALCIAALKARKP